MAHAPHLACVDAGIATCCAVQGQLEPVYRAALALGTANQLTNILRDVGEDAYQRNRIYVPLDELDKYGISEKEVRQGGRFLAVGAGTGQ